MGVDIETYRGRIGTFKFVHGTDVVTIACIINFCRGIKVTGSVLFIGLLLLIAGIESNPGPGNNEPENQNEDRKKIRVTGIPQGVSKDYLHLFFKNQKKQGGGQISDIAFEEENRSAVILFEEPTAVQIVLQKRPIKIKDTVVEVNPLQEDMTSFHAEQPRSSSTIEVAGFPIDKSEEESVEELLELYFEDEDSSGGENVTGMKITENGKALVTFASVTVAQRVIAKKDHTLCEKPLTIVAYHEENSIEDARCFGSSTESMEISSAQVDNTKGENNNVVSAEAVHVEMDETSDMTAIIPQNLFDSTDKLKDEEVQEILHTIGLSEKYPGKIKLQDVISIDLDINDVQNHTYEKLPWMLLRRITSVQSKARDFSADDSIKDDNDTEENIESETDIFGLLQVDTEASESKHLSPFDIFLITIQCCDPMLKQLLFKKLYLCKIALPFVQYNLLSHKWEISVWPFRSLILESKVCSPMITENDILELPVKTVTFANFGRPKFSKSKLLNDILSDEIQDTFYHLNCSGGMSQRKVSNGTVEKFLLTSVGGKRDKFEEAVTFFNMRGDIKQHFSDKVIEFMSKISDTLVLVVDKEHFETHDKIFIKTVSRFCHVLLFIASPTHGTTLKNIKTFSESLPSTDKLRVLSSYNGILSRTPKEIVKQIEKVLHTFFRTTTARSLEDRISTESNLSTDEKEEECVKGKQGACRIFQSIESTGDSNLWKKAITPVHFVHSKPLAEKIRYLYRIKDIKQTESVAQDIKCFREKQLHDITEPVKLFITSVHDYNNSPGSKTYLFRWLSIFLDRRKRQVVPQLISENQSHREHLEDMRNKSSNGSLEIEKQLKLIQDSQERVEDATLGIEHLFREIGHIYEAIIVLHKRTDDFGLPPTESMINSVARLVIEGHTFELVDGDNFYFPSDWVRAILEQISSIIKERHVLAMSVLGIQSSGKSTLLNAMFGSQFPVKSGRCTRGIHMQLLPILSSKDLPFHYVTIIDSEGLRATELFTTRQHHDNELSTVITGLGDVTLLNIMGENTSEIRDVIQVVVHAFLRLKLVNKSLDIGKSFYLAHQNVIDISARDNMRTDLHALMETLDTATKDAAETEGILDISTFRQVIEFDMNSNVWYLPNFWQGNPPMAKVNSDYSDRLSDLKYKLLEKACNCIDKSHKSLSDIAVQLQDLWRGVLTEDFVFCFRNSLEIKAYIRLEVALKHILIQFENEIERIHVECSRKLFSDCSRHDKLQEVTTKIMTRMRDELTKRESVATNRMQEYCDQNEYKDIILQWKEFAIKRVKLLSSELEDRIKTETMRLRDRTCIDIRIKECSLKHETELYERCLLVAKEIKGECLNMGEIENKFEETWDKINSEILNFQLLQTVPDSLTDNFLKCLFDIFNMEKLILKTELVRRGLFQGSDDEQVPSVVSVSGMSKLSGSFSSTGITCEDINFTSKMLGKENTYQMSYFESIVDDKLFKVMDSTIDTCLPKDEEVTYREVRHFLQKAYKTITHMQQQKAEFPLKITGVIKLCVHISCFAQTRFEAYNADYQRNMGIPARLLKYKFQVKEQFVSYLKDRKAEETAAKHIVLIIENVLWDKMCERLRVDIKAALVHHLPQLKFHLIIQMMEDMANNDDFNSFIKYIKNPRTFAKQWMKAMSENYLFAQNSMKYHQLASAVVAEFYSDVKLSVEKCCSSETESLTVEKWIEKFRSHFSNFLIPTSEFRDVVKVLTQIEDLRNFRGNLVECLNESTEKAKAQFESKGREFVKLSGHGSPFKIVFKNAWGCPEHCAYCGEPCAKGFMDHNGANHYSLQHRISCCSGTREDYTHEAAISSCNYNINSMQQHHCDLFGFQCNPEKKQPCSEKWHDFSKYKIYLPDWDIEPNSNMQDCSMFWMWFVAKYKYQLAVHYRYNVSYIPDSWDEITKADAFANLRRIYKIQ